MNGNMRSQRVFLPNLCKNKTKGKKDGFPSVFFPSKEMRRGYIFFPLYPRIKLLNLKNYSDAYFFPHLTIYMVTRDV